MFSRKVLAVLTAFCLTTALLSVACMLRIDSLNASLVELKSLLDNLYDVTISALCSAENSSISMNITKDGSSLVFTTPHTFTLGGIHTLTVPNTDSNGHPFIRWSTGSTDTTINVASHGGYIAYYEGNTINVHETFIIPNEVGIYTSEVDGIEVSEIDWSIKQGEIKPITYYLRNKNLPPEPRVRNFRWTINGTLPSYLHLSMAFVQDTYTEVLHENVWREWDIMNTWHLVFTWTADSDAPLEPVSFTEIFEVQ